MRKKGSTIVTLLCAVIMLSIPVYATVEMIDCPDCNNGHSSVCICGGQGDYLQNCDFCDGVGELNCDLCNGTGVYDNGSCYRCSGDGLMLCNRCHGEQKQLYPCGTPYCSRCGGTGAYPAGSPEHLKQLEDEGKLGSDSQYNATREVTSEEPIIEVSKISTDLIDKKEEIRVSMNLSIPFAEFSEEEITVLKNVSAVELEEVIQKVHSIVTTAMPGRISEGSQEILENLVVDKEVVVNTVCFDEVESITLGFPVKVRIMVNPKEYVNMEKGYVYQISSTRNTVEYLGEVELTRDEVGNVIQVAFVTRGFSDIIITSRLLEII